MKTSKGIPSWGLIFGLLLIVNLGWMGWNWSQNADLRLVAKHFKVEALHTNDMSGIGIYEAKTEQPLWLEFSQDGKPVIENYFFNGKDAFNIVLSNDRPPDTAYIFVGLAEVSHGGLTVKVSAPSRIEFPTTQMASLPSRRFGIIKHGVQLTDATKRMASSSMGNGTNSRLTRTACGR